MGCCTSGTNVVNPTSRKKNNFTLRSACDPLPNNATSSPRTPVHDQSRDSFVNIRDMSSSLEQLQKYFFISKVSDKKPPICPSSFSLNSLDRALTSESCSTRNLLSYDGLNKRPIKRDNIGMEILKAKVHFGANPNKMCTHGNRTCLMFAVVANDLSFTKKLVELGVDINKVTPSGETALSLAIEMQNYELVDYLRSKGAMDVVLSLG